MGNSLVSESLSTPSRALITDDPIDILSFALKAFARGGVAIATLVDIRGGAARALGSQVAVSGDGGFCGYVSGGCVEAAVAAEALLAIQEGNDRTVMFGDGSPFIDIVLPCGGGITVSIHVLRETRAIVEVLERLSGRDAVGLRYVRETQSLSTVDALPRSGCVGDDFVIVYRPSTRVIISGQTIEAQTTARLAKAAGYDVISRDAGEKARWIKDIDPYTAIVLLHHDLDQEEAFLSLALQTSAFYIGALGSTRTHRRRIDRLKAAGFHQSEISRIKAPIGVFGPTRDASSLALSVLADVAASRLMVYA